MFSLFRSRSRGRRSGSRQVRDQLELDATVLRAAFGGLVVGDRLLGAFAFGVDAVGFDALADKVSLDRFGTTQRQFLVVSVGSDRVGVANSDNNLEREALDLRCELVQLGLGLNVATPKTLLGFNIKKLSLFALFRV